MLKKKKKKSLNVICTVMRPGNGKKSLVCDGWK